MFVCVDEIKREVELFQNINASVTTESLRYVFSAFVIE